MYRTHLTSTQLETAGIDSVFRPRDLELLEIGFAELQRLVAAGSVERVAPGLYRLAAAKPTNAERIAMLASAFPGAIVCLLSALSLHGITTQVPHELWLGHDGKARKVGRSSARVNIVRFSGPLLSYGVEARFVLSVPVRVTSPARTIVDCFRYRKKVGLDVAIEALRRAVRSGSVSVDEIMCAAAVCRARTAIKANLTALAL